jgi:hypothetical protein
MTSPNRPVPRGRRVQSALVACALLVPISFAVIGTASASGSYPGNETAVPPPALDTTTACPPSQVTNPGFTDITDDFFKVHIECLAAYGVIKGTSATTYSPTQTVSRGQMAAFLFRLGQAANIPWNTAAPTPDYTDSSQIPTEFRDPVNALTNANIVSGFSDGTYRAAAPVSRGEMSKFIYDFLTFAGAPAPDAHGQDYFYDDDGSTFENPFLNGDARMGFYVGSPGPNGGEVARAAESVLRDQMAGFMARVLEFAVENGAVPNKFVPTTVSESPASTPVGTSVLVAVNGANITHVSVAGPCTPGATQSNTPASNNGSQAINVTVPISSTAATGPCTLTTTVTYSDATTRAIPASVTVTAAPAAAGSFQGLTVVSVDDGDATFEATDGTNTFTFTYGQPGSSYSYDETPGTGGTANPKPISLSQFSAFLSGAEAGTGDTLNVTYGGAGATGTFAFTKDVPAASTGVSATYQNAGPGGTPAAGVDVTWTAPINPDVLAYQVQAASLDASGQPGTFANVGSPVTGIASGNVVTQAASTSFLDTTQASGAQVVYRIIANADTKNGGAASAPSNPSAPVTVSPSSAGTAPAGNGPTNPAITSISTPPFTPSGTTLFVEPHGADGASCGSSASPCQTIDAAVANATSGDTVHVGPGTYHELVVVSKPLTLQGFGATVNAAGLTQGSGQTMDAAAIMVSQPGSGSRVEGLTVHGAYGEGILVLGATNSGYMECGAAGEVPGDCGEGIHLMTATNAQLVDNVSTGNSGGVLVTDELGPATANTVNGNLVTDNVSDCGITLPSHNPNALDASGTPQPAMGGVFANTISNNMALDNGTRGFGAGILFAAAGPGMASYNNMVTGNIINGNGASGVTIHSHTPNQNVSGNTIQNNTIGQNNLLGDGDASDFVTTGILVSSAAVPQSETITGNTIYDNQTQIFTTSNVTVH